VLDFYLERVIKAFLIDTNKVRELFEGAYAPLADLSGKIKSAYLMGLITKTEAERVTAIRKVRNIFAHEIDATFTHHRVAALCNRAPIRDGRVSDREAFVNAAIEAGIALIDRDVAILQSEKRKQREEPRPASIFDPPEKST
jgi:hypothetical protein